MLSKCMCMIAFKEKRDGDTVKASQSLSESRMQKLLQSDAGSEYQNKLLQKILKQGEVQFFKTLNNTKRSVME